MSNLVRNLEDRFSDNEAHIIQDIEATAGFKIFDSISEEQKDIKPTKEQLNHMMLLNLVPGRNGENDTLPAADSQELAGSHGDETENMDGKYKLRGY